MFDSITDRRIALFEELLGRPEVAAIQTEKRRKVVEHRAALLREKVDIARRETDMVRRYDAALAPAERRVRDCRAALSIAEHAVAQLQTDHRAAMLPLSQRAAVIEGELFATRQHDILSAFAAEMRAEMEAAQKSAQTITELGGPYGNAQVEKWSNWPGVQARLAAIGEVLRVVRDCLPMEALDDAQLAQRLQGLRESLPEIEAAPSSIRDWLTAPRWPNGFLRA